MLILMRTQFFDIFFSNLVLKQLMCVLYFSDIPFLGRTRTLGVFSIYVKLNSGEVLGTDEC